VSNGNAEVTGLAEGRAAGEEPYVDDIARVDGGPIAPDLVAAVRAIAAEAFVEHGFSIDEELARPWARVWLAHRLARAPRGRARSTTTGFLVAWHVADELHVLNIAVSAALRSRGIATELMRAALEYASEHEIRIVLLEVRRSNEAALALYRKLSFAATGIRAGYYADTGEDAIEMVLVLDPETGQPVPALDEIHIDG
jgi:[ribosomal protein S18]-alanine N-acetyltransferase